MMLVSAEVRYRQSAHALSVTPTGPGPAISVGTFAPPIIVSAPAPASQTAIKEFQPAIKELLRTLYRQSANLFVGGTMSAMISNFPTPATPRQDQPGPKGPIHQTNQHREG